MKEILLAYGTSYGHTEQIAQRIADRLGAHGLAVTLCRGDGATASQPMDRYDGFVVGGSIIVGKHQRYIVDFVQRNLAWLTSHPSAFFSVSGSAASPYPEKRAEAQAMLEAFLKITSWRPLQTATFGGMIAYTKYNFVLRWVIKQITKRSGGPTDTSRDHDVTDWEAVDRFAEKLAQLFAPTEPRTPVTVV